MNTVMNSAILFMISALFAGSALSQVSSVSSDSLVQYGKRTSFLGCQRNLC